MKCSLKKINVSESSMRDVVDKLNDLVTETRRNSYSTIRPENEKKTKKRRHRIIALIVIASSVVTICTTIFILCRFVLPKFAFRFEPDSDESAETEVDETGIIAKEESEEKDEGAKA